MNKHWLFDEMELLLAPVRSSVFQKTRIKSEPWTTASPPTRQLLKYPLKSPSVKRGRLSPYLQQEGWCILYSSTLCVNKASPEDGMGGGGGDVTFALYYKVIPYFQDYKSFCKHQRTRSEGEHKNFIIHFMLYSEWTFKQKTLETEYNSLWKRWTFIFLLKILVSS
jgi:hypothetical protein